MFYKKKISKTSKKPS